MSIATPPGTETVADLLKRLGDVPPSRVRMVPTPGTATEKDVVRIHDREDRLFELVDGVLVEKGMGFHESRFAMFLGSYLIDFLRQHKLGTILGADGMMRLFPGLVRIPDVAFISWERFSKSDHERAAIPTVAPDLVVEILSKSNTRKEMERKLDEYFRAGVRLAWYVDPKARTVRVYTARHDFTTLTIDDHLDGGDVLPGFRLAIAEWFAEVEQTGS
ncbi:MAG: Uma2 family endonuclease [Paludisphaera borealis]|uniref:Uma2 family endonuclease n=1 Tax=Paludisphaera borealis TaxID=1387353 RepID=UPI00284B5FA8|nr:Uma2 family endonuclease [Paludisphaera borealis]MDR3621820.1 Uma2 family endonuclease [Paludisphaera borealis]